MTTRKKSEPDAVDPDEGGVTPADPDAPSSSPPPASLDPDAVQSAPSPTHPDVLAVADESPITMADVASLQGIGLAPDASTVREASTEDVPFISAGMASDLEQQGWTIDPATGKKIVKE